MSTLRYKVGFIRIRHLKNNASTRCSVCANHKSRLIRIRPKIFTPHIGINPRWSIVNRIIPLSGEVFGIIILHKSTNTNIIVPINPKNRVRCTDC